MLILDEFDKEASKAYYESFTLKVDGKLNEKAFVMAIGQIAERHEALRTVIKNDLQFVLEKIDPSITIRDFDKDQLNEDEIKVWKQEWDSVLFDLKTGPLWRIAILKLESNKYEILITAHHILFDGFSVGILLNELKTFYENITQGKPVNLEKAIPFRNFIQFQNNLLQSEALQRQKKYWLSQLDGEVEPLNLPYQHLSGKRFEGESITTVLPTPFYHKIKKVGIKNGCTTSSTLAGVFSVLISRITNQTKFILGMPVANRTAFGGGETMIGYCSHITPLCYSVDANDTFGVHAKKCQDLMFSTLESYQDYPFANLLEEVKEKYNGGNPLINVTFNTERVALPEIDDLTLEIRPKEVTHVPFDIRVDILETDKEILFSIGYNKSRFSVEFIHGLRDGFIGLCHQISENPELSLKDLSTVVNPEDILRLGQGKIIDSAFESLVDSFERQVNKNGDKSALTNNGELFSYKELAKESEAVAYYLINNGIEKGDVIGVLMNRGFNFVSTALGILKAGGVYLPIDPILPAKRIEYMVNDADVMTVISDLKMNEGLELVKISKWSEIDKNNYQKSCSLPLLSEKDLCYIIYTSGSTGKPKGVKVSHGALNNLIKWHTKQYHVDQSTTGFQLAAISFDASVWELWPYLAVGATVCQFPAGKMVDPQLVIEVLKHNKVNIAFIPTALVKHIVNADWNEQNSLRTILTGGDRLEKMKLDNLPFELYNNYGPTETTVVASSGKVDINSNIHPHIGKPIDNGGVRIVDQFGHVVPAGIPGELEIIGKGIAEGYTDELLTQERFIQNKYGERSYKTGDRAYIDHIGDIHFIGRVDHQIQLRGYRIELGEIENALLDHQGIVETKLAVTTSGKEGGTELIAYVYTKDENITSKVLKVHLKKYLPSYMIPSIIKFTISPFELNDNGKVDFKNLERQEVRVEVASLNTEPKNEIEAGLLRIWKDTLENDSIALDDDFFMIGGHSLIAVEMIDEINRMFDVQLSIAVLITSNTIESLAATIEANENEVNLIIPLKKGTDSEGKKLVLFAPIGGNVLCYSKLAENLSVSVYGIQSPFLSNGGNDLENFEQLVEFYVHEIKVYFEKINDNIAIGGFCAGGLLALEVHKKLKKEHPSIGQLLLIDSSAPSEVQEENMHGEDIKYLLLDDFYKDMRVQNGKNVLDLQEKLKPLSEIEQIVFIRQQAIKDKLLSEKVSVQMIQMLFDGFYKNATVITPFVPEEFEEHIVLYRAEKIAPNLEDIKEFHLGDLGWSKFNRGLTEVIDVPGDHNTMLNQENAKVLAKAINNTLKIKLACISEH